MVRLQGPDFYCDLIVTLVPRWTECIIFVGIVLKNNNIAV